MLQGRLTPDTGSSSGPAAEQREQQEGGTGAGPDPGPSRTPPSRSQFLEELTHPAPAGVAAADLQPAQPPATLPGSAAALPGVTGRGGLFAALFRSGSRREVTAQSTPVKGEQQIHTPAQEAGDGASASAPADNDTARHASSRGSSSSTPDPGLPPARAPGSSSVAGPAAPPGDRPTWLAGLGQRLNGGASAAVGGSSVWAGPGPGPASPLGAAAAAGGSNGRGEAEQQPAVPTALDDDDGPAYLDEQEPTLSLPPLPAPASALAPQAAEPAPAPLELQPRQQIDLGLGGRPWKRQPQPAQPALEGTEQQQQRQEGSADGGATEYDPAPLPALGSPILYLQEQHHGQAQQQGQQEQGVEQQRGGDQRQPQREGADKGSEGDSDGSGSSGSMGPGKFSFAPLLAAANGPASEPGTAVTSLSSFSLAAGAAAGSGAPAPAASLSAASSLPHSLDRAGSGAGGRPPFLPPPSSGRCAARPSCPRCLLPRHMALVPALAMWVPPIAATLISSTPYLGPVCLCTHSTPHPPPHPPPPPPPTQVQRVQGTAAAHRRADGGEVCTAAGAGATAAGVFFGGGGGGGGSGGHGTAVVLASWEGGDTRGVRVY